MPTGDSCHDDKWCDTFKPRPSAEPVRNCSTIDISVKKDIVTIVTDAILKQTPGECIRLRDGREWNRGGMGMSL